MRGRRDVVKSQTAIKNAFLSICGSKDIRKITVQEIIDTANVSRGTFYAHFSDIYDLKEKIENEIIEIIFSNAQSMKITDIIKDPFPVVYETLISFYNNSENIKSLIGKTNNYGFFFKCEQKLLEILSTSENYYGEHIKRSVTDNCITGMIIKNCYSIVINGEAQENIKRTAEIISDFIYKAIK